MRVEDALEPSFCDDVVERVLRREGISDDDRSTWPATPLHCPVDDNWDLDEVAPAVAKAVATLVGNAERVEFAGIQDNLIVNFPRPGASGVPSPAMLGGWHKDGDWFRHFLDSPEQALLVVVFWRDVSERQGPTVAAIDSIPRVARLLAERTEGLEPKELRRETDRIVASCTDVRPLTGRQRTVLLAHPFLLHTVTANETDSLRIISNTSVMLRRPMRFDRPDGSFSPLEQSILDALGVDFCAYRATGERRRLTPERELRWRAQVGDRTGRPR